MNTTKYLLFSALFILSVACSPDKKEKEEQAVEEVEVLDEQDFEIPENLPNMIRGMAEAHNIRDFHNEDVIAFDIDLTFGGENRLSGRIYSRTNSTAVKVERADGVVLLYDGEEVYISPDTANYAKARFDALAWSYFALAPFKFADDGSRWGDVEYLPLRKEGDSLKSINLTYAKGVGQTSEDWYQVYQNDTTNLLEAMAYIVTYGDTSQEEAEKNPHAIVYKEYQPVDGAILSWKWEFYTWSKEKGLGEKIGEATLNNMQFMKEDPDLFKLTTGFELVPAG